MKYIKFNDIYINKGLEFENLIQHLLREEYGESFIHTSYTNDGGKDFESTGFSVLNNTKKIWAECKNYSSSLSYDDITKTLLMAYIKSINKILIFSYSPVNKRFYKSIAEYKIKTGIDVEIYDDIILEQLLIKYRHKDWFSDFLHVSDSIEIITDKINLFYQYNISKEYKQNRISKKTHVKMHELIVLNLTIINKNATKEKVYIDFSDINNYPCFELLDRTLAENKHIKILFVSPCSSQLVEIKLRIVSFQEIYHLPTICVNGEKIKIRKRLFTDWLAAVPYLQDSSCFDLKYCLNYIDNNQKLSVICIEGNSGVGKSRFLTEIHHSALKFDQQSFYFDVDAKKVSLKIICQELFSFFSKLPFFKKNKKYITKFADTGNQENALEYAAQVLYNPNFSFIEELDEIAKFIFYYLKETSTTILLDNVQRFDFYSIELIDKLIALSSNQFCPSSIILSINTTYLYGSSKIENLKNKLELLSRQKPQRFCKIELKGFDYKTAQQYVQKCLELDAAEMFKYHTFIGAIIETAGVNPLFLQNYLMFLKQNNILQIKEHELVVKNIQFLFEEKIISNNSSFSNIFSCLDCNLYKELTNKSAQKDYLQITGILSICTSVQEKVTIRLVNDKKLLDRLVSSGIIVFNYGNRCYSFKHAEMQKYYKKKYGIKYLDIPEALNIFNTLINKEQYIEQIFLLEIQSDIININTIDKIIEKIKRYEMDFENPQEIFYEILSLIEFNVIKNTTDTIFVIKQVVTYSSDYFGVKKSLDYYGQAYRIVKKNFDGYKATQKYVVDIFINYLRHLLNEGQFHKCESLILEMLSLAEKAPSNCIDNYKFELYKIEVLAYYKTGEILKATKTLQKIDALLWKQSEHTDMRAEYLMLCGNVFCKGGQRFSCLNEIVQNWENAFSKTSLTLNNYFNMTWEQKSLILNLCIKKATANMIGLTTENKTAIIEQLENLLNKTGMTYFEVKIRHILSIYYMLSTIPANTEKALKFAKESLEILCLYYGNKYLYATSLFLIAEIYKYKKDYDKMYSNFLGFYGILSQLNCEKERDVSDEYLLVEMALSIRKFKTKISETFNANILNNIADRHLREKLLSIIYMDDLNFYYYEKINRHQSLLYDEKTECNYPIV